MADSKARSYNNNSSSSHHRNISTAKLDVEKDVELEDRGGNHQVAPPQNIIKRSRSDDEANMDIQSMASVIENQSHHPTSFSTFIPGMGLSPIIMGGGMMASDSNSNWSNDGGSSSSSSSHISSFHRMQNTSNTTSQQQQQQQQQQQLPVSVAVPVGNRNASWPLPLPQLPLNVNAHPQTSSGAGSFLGLGSIVNSFAGFMPPMGTTGNTNTWYVLH